MLIEITRKLVAADASIDCCAICGNDLNLGSVYAVATADRGEEIRLMCPTCPEYLNCRKEDAEGPTLRTWPAGGWLSTEELEEARRLFPESMFGTHDDLLAAATDRAADERKYGATLVWGMERETAVPE